MVGRGTSKRGRDIEEERDDGHTRQHEDFVVPAPDFDDAPGGRYKLRTGLSVLGVVIGVAAVIAMLSVSEGARAETRDKLSA